MSVHRSHPHSNLHHRSQSHRGRLHQLAHRVTTVKELAALFARNGRWWLVPFIGILAVTAVLLVVVSVLEYVAPFVYTVF